MRDHPGGVALQKALKAGATQPKGEADRVIEALGVPEAFETGRRAGFRVAHQREADGERGVDRNLRVPDRECRVGAIARRVINLGKQLEFPPRLLEAAQ